VLLGFLTKLRMEEQWMRSQFGETYATYAHRTAALVPYVF
jgi:protein-S-isoprenylcysteine O-methyltransferase Ste14